MKRPCSTSTRRGWLQAAGAAALALAGRSACALAPPAGPVVLTIRGSVALPNAGSVADFDMPMLEALPQSSFTTGTPWYAAARRFTGPLLRDVLAAAGAEGTTLKLTALNDYAVEMPYDDARRHDPIVARLLDGRPMAVRDKGPLFLVYPFDSSPGLRSAIYYGRSAWQLRWIDVA